MARIVAQVVARRDRLVGVYSMGSGNTTLLSALRSSPRSGRLVVIAHELTPATRQALIEGEIDAVIAQNVGHLIRSSLRVLRNVCDDLPIYEAQERLRIEVVLRENLP
jgi:LacI family transcriptional regulator